MKAIGELVSNWWLRDEKYTILSVMKGIFACPDLSGLINTTNTKISGEAVLDTKQLLGDACDLLSMIYMNSAVFTELQKQNFIQYIPVAESKIQIPTYLGYRVIMDDTITKEGDSYVTYLLSKGCIQRGIGTPVGFVGTETDRDSLGNGGKDVLINRQAKILHPKGISWIGSGKIENETPTDAELEVGTNWKRVADLKKIGMAKLVHTL
jgi:hypothetical protein